MFTNITVRAITDDEISRFCRIKRGLDWGYAVDPVAYVAANIEHNRLYIYSEFYKVGAKFDVVANAIKKENKNNTPITCESAEPRSNDELRDRGLRVITAKKGPGSVEHGITWLQNLDEIIIDPVRCPNTKREFYEYEYAPDNNGGFKDGFPDKNNHTIDAVRYALESEIGKRKVKTMDRRKMGIR